MTGASSVTAAPTGDHSRREEVWHGLRDTFPLMVGALPFGIIFGSLGIAQGFSPLEVASMSIFVFSGSAQFMAVGLVATKAALWVILAATFIINLRHLLYAANLVSHVRHLPQRWRFPLAAMLTDETFAVMDLRYRERGRARYAHWYYLASCVGMWLNWNFWTLAGVLLGQSFPGVKDWGLEFAMVATFIGIVIPGLRTPPLWAAAITAGLVATYFNNLDYKVGLMLGALAGVLVGLVLDLRRKPGAARTVDAKTAEATSHG
ncbi:MAG TPA: AzlC family ABC transporter permease [Terriglobia bacterium]|nr:AzlC family ABC transporter permease [Terriglobia bacterium]